MASFTVQIPAAVRSGFELLARLDETSAAGLVSNLRSAEPFRTAAQLRDCAEAALPEADKPEASRLVQSLLTLVTSFKEASPDELAEAVSESDDLDADPVVRKQLQSRLSQLLTAPALATTARAIDLLTLNQRNYRAARVITDIRPVFGPDVKEASPGAVIVQTLQLRMWDQDGQEDSLYLAMDATDLQEMQDAIGRALDKTETLKRQLAEAKMYYFELDKREQ